MPKSKKKVKVVKTQPTLCTRCGDITSDGFEKCGNCLALEHIKKENPYFISLAFGDKVYEGSGATVLDALQAMPIPIKIVSKGLLKLTDGVKKFEQMWQPVRIKRLFQPLSQAVQSKMLSSLMR